VFVAGLFCSSTGLCCGVSLGVGLDFGLLSFAIFSPSEDYMEDLNFVEADILRLTQNNYRRSEEAGKDLDNKAQQIISTSSVVVGLVSAFNLAQGSISPERRLIFVGLLIAYMVSFLLSVDALFPRDWVGEPLKATWHEYMRVSKKDRQEYYDWVMSSYIEAMKVNERIITRKVRDVEFALFATGIQMIIVVAIVLFLP
jgi:hypothetical protein